MKQKFLNIVFVASVLLIVILLFTIIDHVMHGLQNTWSVPDYYFRNKIPFGFLWGLVGLFFARKVQAIWLKALVVAGIVAVTLQFRYFIEGYALDFVLIFLLIHFVILYVLSAGMFFVFAMHNQKFGGDYGMKEISIALIALVVVGIGTYYFVFSSANHQAPVTNPYPYIYTIPR